jgi:hypothetical protein
MLEAPVMVAALPFVLPGAELGAPTMLPNFLGPFSSS